MNKYSSNSQESKNVFLTPRNSNPLVFVYTNKRYQTLLQEVIYLKQKKSQKNLFFQHLADEPYPRVMEPIDADTIIAEIKTKPRPFKPDIDLINKVRNQVFTTEYIKIVNENADIINFFLTYFPERRSILLNQLTIIRFLLPSLKFRYNKICLPESLYQQSKQILNKNLMNKIWQKNSTKLQL